MHRAHHSSSADPGPPPAALEQHPERLSAEPDAERRAEITTVHVRRMALLAAISAGMLARLTEAIRLEIESTDGARSCRRLAAGSVDCACRYCELFWSRLEEMLNAHLSRRRAPTQRSTHQRL